MSTYDLCLAQIAAASATTSLVAVNITDTRTDGALCGYAKRISGLYATDIPTNDAGYTVQGMPDRKMQPDLKRTNENPLSTFAAQMITVDLSVDTGVIIEYSIDPASTSHKIIAFMRIGYEQSSAYFILGIAKHFSRYTTPSAIWVAFGEGVYKADGSSAAVNNQQKARPVCELRWTKFRRR